MYMNADQASTICEYLEIALRTKLDEFDQAESMQDKVSQQRAIRAARDVKRISRLLTSIANGEGGSDIDA